MKPLKDVAIPSRSIVWTEGPGNARSAPGFERADWGAMLKPEMSPPVYRIGTISYPLVSSDLRVNRGEVGKVSTAKMPGQSGDVPQASSSSTPNNRAPAGKTTEQEGPPSAGQGRLPASSRR